MTATENPTNHYTVPSVLITTARTGGSSTINALGMRPMQERAYAKRGEQYLLIKSPPASGKSRALMFIALDKLHNQGLKQAIIVVPERSIGGSFADEKLTEHGFHFDWIVQPNWNLCNAPGEDNGKVATSKIKAVGAFLASADQVLVCTHATFRFAIEEYGLDAFAGRLIAVDEFHHVSSNPDNKLGSQLTELIGRDRTHVVAMTGSYFRGDTVAVLSPQDEARFETVTYTYYEQLNGYQYLKSLDIGYFFYTGRYLDAIMKVLDPALKTIVHIPNVNSRESLKDKPKEVEEIMDRLGTWRGVDEATGFHRIELPGGRVIKVADLVDDRDALRRTKVLSALKDPAQKNNRDHVDIILALGMAKEGFDWIWCEHALTIGYRSSLTEIVQIIGRATRDAPGKERSRFTNLIAEPAADEASVVDAVNDTLKAIAASLLMEQVLAPRFEFTPKNTGPKDGFDYGDEGYQEGQKNVGVNAGTGQVHVEIKGLAMPKSPEAARICLEDLNEVVTSFIQDKSAVERGLFDRENTVSEELTQVAMGKIVRDKYPDLSADDQEAIELTKSLLAFLPSNNLSEAPVYDTPDPLTEDLLTELDTLIPDSNNAPYDMHTVIEAVLDDNEFLEVQQLWAPNIVVGFGRIEGHSVGVVGNNPMQFAGTLDIDAAEKAARFVRTCDAFNIPVLTFVDVPGYLPGVGQEHAGIIRRGAKLLYAYSEATVPLVTIITRKAYGGAYVVMGSKHLGADINLAWPTSQIAVVGAAGAVNILYRKEIAAASDPETARADYMQEYDDTLAHPYIAAERGFIDAVIQPRETRAEVVKALRQLRTKRQTLPPKKHGNIPL